MQAELHKDLVRRYYEALWNRWDFAVADELMAESVVFRGSLGIRVQGREGFKEYMRTVRRGFPDFHNRIVELIAEDDSRGSVDVHGDAPGQGARHRSDRPTGELRWRGPVPNR